MERIKLNLIPSGVAPIVHLSQYDDGRQFGIDLFEGESVYVLDGTETLTVNSRKPDGHVVVLTVTNTGTSSLDVDVIEQLTAVHGVSYAKLKIEKGSVTIATLPFLIDVSRDPLENGDPSESFVDNLNTQIAQAVADQYDADSVVFDANPTAGHGVGFAVTSEGVLNAIPDELDDLSDVTTTTPSSGEALVWDGSKWVNGTPSLDIDDLNNVTITTPTDGEILVYNNGTWENQANPSSTTNFAPDYDDTATYNTNDKVIYQGLLYVCLEDSITGAWDGTKWQQISVADLTAELLPIQSGSATNTKDYIDTGLSGKADSSAVNTAFATIGDIKVSTLSAGNKTIGDIQTWAKSEGKGLFWGTAYMTTPFSGWGVYWVYNRIVASAYSEIIIIQNDHIITSFTSSLDSTTPTWTTKSGSLA